MIAKLNKKFSQWLGEENNIGTDVEIPSRRRINQFLENYPATTLLCYANYDETTNLFFNKNSMGFVLSLQPLTTANGQIANAWAALLSDELPEDCCLQLLLWASPKIGNITKRWVEARGKETLYQQLANRRADFYQQGAFSSMTGAIANLARDYQLLLSISFPKQANEEREIQQLLQLRETLLATLGSFGILGSVPSIQQFLSINYDLLYPSRQIYPAVTQWSPYEELSIQLKNPEAEHRIDREHISINHQKESWRVSILSVADFPEEPWGLWGNIDLIGDMYRDSLHIPVPFCLHCGIYIPKSSKAQVQAAVKAARAEQLAQSPIGKYISTIQRIYQDWQFVKQRLAANDRLVKTLFQVILYSPSDQSEIAERKVKDLFRTKGWRLSKERFIHYSSWLASFPMMLGDGLWDDLEKFGRLRTMPSQTAAHLLPLFAEWKGLPQASLLLLGRRGQLFFWDNFNDHGDINSNYNVCVVASSGAGKSVLINEKVMTEVSSGGQVWIIDVGKSYQKTCQLLHGEFIEFTSNRQLILNPFTFIEDISESLELLKPLFALMARPTTTTSDEENAYLEKAIHQTWQQYRQSATITQVAETLESYQNKLANNLSHLLYPFTRLGMYGRYFEGEANLDMRSPLIVLELEELKNKKDLQKVVLWVLMQYITEMMYHSDRSQRKSVIIDEAWDLLKGDNKSAKLFIEAICRRARKYGGCLVTITQSTREYFANAAATAAWQLSDWRIFLRQNPDSIDAMKSAKDLSMDPSMERLLKDLKRTDHYSELLIYGQGQYTVGRLFLDPFSRILYSSKGSEFEAVNRLVSQGKPLEDAISEVAAIVMPA